MNGMYEEAKFTEELRQRINNAGFSDEFKQQIKSAQKEEGRKMFERLTHRSKYGIAYTKIAVNESNMVDVGECYTGRIIDRLAAYEDTGLTPGQIESQQRENEQLKDENASLRNWNACEEELYNELLESDKRRWELELELEDANNYRAGLEAIVDKLRAHVARMRDVLQYYADVKWKHFCPECKEAKEP